MENTGNYSRFLSAHELLNWYFTGKFACTPSESIVFNDLMLLARNARPDLPDRYHQAELENTLGKDICLTSGSIAKAMLKSLNAVCSSLLTVNNEGKIYAVWKQFEAWQDLLSQISPLPLLAYSYFGSPHGEKSLMEAVAYSTLPPCMDGASIVDAVDLHMHLNGTTETDFVWQYCLENQGLVANEFDEACKSPDVARFYKQCHISSPRKLSLYIRLGRWLQESIARRVVKCSISTSDYNETLVCSQKLSIHMLNNFMKGGGDSLHLAAYYNRTSNSKPATGVLLYPDNDKYLHPLALLKKTPNTEFTSVQYEAQMLYHAYKLIDEGDRILPLLLHCYLLLQACVVRMTVHHRDQVGFEQFQYITNAGLRERMEKASYEQRFRQLQGMHGNPYMEHIEGRFSPKADVDKNLEMLFRIEKCYDGMQPKPCRTLSLVAHFIKRKDSDTPCIIYRHRELRKSVLDCARSLLISKNIRSEKALSIVGKDAAANELDAPPEVFAPAFAMLDSCGIKSTTYHVGEDFRHLLSGLRAIDEAVTFLNMRAGDRLGHATALGFPPKLWSKRAKHIYISKGEWLDNLVWILALVPSFMTVGFRNKLEKSIQKLAAEIYPTHCACTSTQLFQAWKMRSIDPTYFEDVHVMRELDSVLQESKIHAAPFITRKAFVQQAIANFLTSARNFPEAFALYRDYHSNATTWEKYRQEIAIPMNTIPDKLIAAAQAALINKLIHQDIVVEVMPTSNKRISLYNSYHEHHMVAWSNPKTSQPVPKFVICTDDPGIFATNLKNEMTHFANSIPLAHRNDALKAVCHEARKRKFSKKQEA